MHDPYWLTNMNHSCEPNVVLNVEGREVRVIAPIAAGQGVTFFYPSTELDMDEAFACCCGAPSCLGQVRGARHLTAVQRSRYLLAPHVLAAVRSST